MVIILKRYLLIVFSIVLLPFFLFIAIIFAVYSRKGNKTYFRDARLVWGPTPVINNRYWSKAMQNAGWISQTLMEDFYSAINKREDFDEFITDRYWVLPKSIKLTIIFLESLFRFDVFFLPFSGWVLGKTPYWRLEAIILKLAGKRIVVIPYGADAFVYRNIRSTSLIHGLLISYPKASRMQDAIQQRVSYWCKHANCVIPGGMGPDGFGRWDVLLASSLHIDTEMWKPSMRFSPADGTNGTVYISHSPNHRGGKGSEFIIAAIDKLREEGLQVELVLTEKIQNDELRRILEYEIDILVDQIISTGHGMNGLEGMAIGLPVISNLEDDTYLLPMRRWSFFGECPIVSASPETIVEVLRKLVTRPILRHQLGRAGRQYVEKYHGYDSAQYLFSNVLKYIYGESDCLLNLYHPLLGEYTMRGPSIDHPLVKNHIID